MNGQLGARRMAGLTSPMQPVRPTLSTREIGSPPRHLGPDAEDAASMLQQIGYADLESLISDTIPDEIRLSEPMSIPDALGEYELVKELSAIAARNHSHRSYIGMGYSPAVTPPVIQRNVLENPGWYTQYTPYQAEISQGRLEALLNFQTMVSDLTGLPLSNSSLLDEATAAAEAMAMCFAITRNKKQGFFVARDCHPQTIEVVRTRAEPLGVELVVDDVEKIDFEGMDLAGVLIQYPATDGSLSDFEGLCSRARAAGTVVAVATDLLALTLLRPPGEFGADIALGNSQRFGVPLGAGGPHAAFLATREEHARKLPGRVVGVSKDSMGTPAYRLALQTREQHIRRDKATSNICTAQVLLAIMASMYAVYHGPAGLRSIATRVHAWTKILADALTALGFAPSHSDYFDTLSLRLGEGPLGKLRSAAGARKINFRYDGDSVGISLDETVLEADVVELVELFAGVADSDSSPTELVRRARSEASLDVSPAFRRKTDYLTHPVFHGYHAEHELLRYIHRLQAKDLSMTTSMIPLGSCTMKLNATTEMLPVTWPEFGAIHPFAPPEQTAGYRTLYEQLEGYLEAVTGFDGVSLQPNAGSQGEYAGLLVIRAFHASRGDNERDVCLIPTSAHGTNPASAVMAGFRVVVVDADERGYVDIEDLRRKAQENASRLGALMITYPSTHGVFEEGIRTICDIVHEHGGQVYMDGANMNAQVGLTSPGSIGADVCHLNLHKTFCIPHGGGGPGMGPIGVASHLVPFLPGHPLSRAPDDRAIGPVSAAPYGSPSILPISWAYIRMMGPDGLTEATRIAILNANYMASRLESHYPVLYQGSKGRVAHEFILDCRQFERSSGVKVEDIAKRLMDYGFHAPTMSFPVAGTLMIEPTESETKAELDRLCDALIAIREEIADIEAGRADREDNVLINAPHTAMMVTASDWPHPYSREQAAYPASWVRRHKYWPPVGRIDNAYGDRNLVCTCVPVEAYV